MDVLLTNDDGIRARGLRALYAALLEAGHTVHVVAPMTQQSGVGHSLTVFEPVRALDFEEPDFKGLGIYGTPTDCVKLALGQLLPKKPDMVISGINAGPNVGPDILYSGTVGAATEAAHEDLPSIAVSHDCYRLKTETCCRRPGTWWRWPSASTGRNWAAAGSSTSTIRPARWTRSWPARVCPQTSAVWVNTY